MPDEKKQRKNHRKPDGKLAVPKGAGDSVTMPTLRHVEHPRARGGALLTGGVPGNRGGGRTPSIIREGFRKNLPATERRMRARVVEMERLIAARKAAAVAAGKPLSHEESMADQERLYAAERSLAEFQAKYGLGTTQTATDTEGKDVPRPGRLTADESKSRLTELLRN